jgi:RNA polymerase-binding transcription factor DksA
MMKITGHPQPVIKPHLIRREVEERLEKERRKIADEAARLAGEMEGEWQERDSPSEIEIREVEFNHRAALQSRLRHIDEALLRMRHESYGACIDCQKQIPAKRLLNDLTVSRCLACQTLVDGKVPGSSI